jgi:hypothetical protein
MKKCKCIKESKWFLIDDSFDLDSKLKGGEFSFQTGEIYEYDETETFFGRGYSVIHPIHGKENPTGFDENRFLEHFEIINS